MLNTILGGSKATEPRSDADYQNAKQIAANGSDEERVALASDEFLEPEILYYFANDPSPDVRSAVAGNPSMPPHAAPTLAKDENAQVRSQLADTLGNTLPSIDPASNQRATSAVYDALDTLAQDSLEDIRSVIAESLKELDSVPKPIVSMLARDVSDRVSMPVLELSPLISDDELVEIIQSTDSEGRLCAISRRETCPLLLRRQSSKPAIRKPLRRCFRIRQRKLTIHRWKRLLSRRKPMNACTHRCCCVLLCPRRSPGAS